MASISLKYKSKQGNLTAPGDVDPGAMIPIATTTLSTATATVTFSNIPQSYEHLQIRGISASTASQAILIRCNNDATNIYYNHELVGDGSNASANSRTPRTGAVIMPQGMSATANIFAGLVVDILDYTNTNKYKTIRSLSGNDLNGSGYVWFNSSAFPSTSAVTQIDLVNNGSTFTQYSSFALYGIKRAGA